MTLVAYAVTPERAQIVTDSLSYSPHLDRIGASTKLHLFPHLNSAMASTGSIQFAQTWGYTFSMEAPDRPAVRDFDALHEKALEWLPVLWGQLPESERLHQAGSTIIHLGWSPAAGRMRAVRYRLDDDGLTTAEDDAWYTPDPSRFGFDGPPFDPPQTTAEWIHFAERVQALYARPEVPTIPMGGPLILTELRRDEAHQRRVAMLDDSESYWRAITAGTIHPAAIAENIRAAGVDPHATPCPCGADATLADCHLARAVDRPLAGLSGYPAVESVTPERLPAPPGRVGRNAPCPCGSGAKAKRCCEAAA